MDTRDLKTALDRRLSHTHLPQNTRQAILNSVQDMKFKRRRPVKRTLLIGIAAFLVLSIGTLAAGNTVSVWLHHLFHQASEDSLNRMGTLLGISDNDNGVTVTAEAIIGDEQNAVLVLTARRDDDKPFIKLQHEDRLTINDFTIAKLGPEAGDISYWVNNTSTDDHVLRLEVSVMDDDTSLIGSTLHIEMNNIIAWNTENAHTRTFASHEGDWSLDIPINYKDSSCYFTAAAVNLDDRIHMVFESIRISPISMTIQADLSFANGFWEDNTHWPALILKDGTEIISSNIEGSRIPGDDKNGKYLFRMRFEHIIALDEIQALRCGEQIIPLTAQ